MLSTMSQIFYFFIYLVVIFILLMKSESVIGMYLKFAEFRFLFEIDDYVCHLGKEGIIIDEI